MATIGAGVLAAATWPPSIRRPGKLRPIQKCKLWISASEKQPQLRAQSLFQNGVVLEKKTATESEDGGLSLRDYFDQSRELISRSDGGPPRWLSPVECAKDSPLFLYLPGVDGVGLGLMLHHKRLSKIFGIRCLHIPLEDRTSFKGLVKFVERAVRIEHSQAPNRPIYLAGESFGGCLALAVASRNPDIDLMLILANPATSFGKSHLQPKILLTLSAFIPQQINSSLPYVLTLLLGAPVKMVTSAIGKRLPSVQMMKQLSQDTKALSSYLSVISNAFTVETLRWKLELLKSGAAFANSQLHAVKAQTLILASGQDQFFPSREEAERLSKVLPDCKIRVFEDKGHALFLEEGVNFHSILVGASFCRQGRRDDHVMDYFPPTLSEFQTAYKQHQYIEALTNPVILSTLGDGSIVRGLGGIPCDGAGAGAVVYVGIHIMFGLDTAPLLSRFRNDKNISLRTMAHPTLFTNLKQGRFFSSFFDLIHISGAVPVSPSNFYRLLSSKSHILLYPGGGREAFHRKGEECKLFWPEQSEFVRIAAKFGAKIVPFGIVGEDDMVHLLLDYDDLMNIPYFKNDIQNKNSQIVNVRKDAVGEVANQDFHIPIVVPKLPGRVYYLLGKPILTQGRKEELKSREKAHELYLEVKSEVEKCISYLKEKRESDPFRNIFARLGYQATHGFDSEVPTFNLSAKDS